MTIFFQKSRFIRRFLLLMAWLFTISFQALPQSTTIKALVTAEVHETHLFFYPSTLRMLNLNKDPAFYDLVKNVEHLRILTFGTDSVVSAGSREMIRLLQEEGFEEAMTFRSNGAYVQMYSKAPNDRMEGMVVLVAQDGEGFMVELTGEVNPMKVYELFQNGVDMPVLDSYFKDKEEEQKRREKYQEFRQSLEEEEKAKADSLANQDTIKQ